MLIKSNNFLISILTLLKKYIHLIILATVVTLLIAEEEEEEEEPILTGSECDLRRVFLVSYCEDDKEVLEILNVVNGSKENINLTVEKNKHQKHSISKKLMCYKVAYGCPRCSFWPRNFTGGNCPYCGLKLVQSKYWSPVIVIFDKKICIYSGIFPHVKEEK